MTRAEHIEALARAYVRAVWSAEFEVSGPARGEAVNLSTLYFHDLCLVLGEPCNCCEVGTCPGPVIDTEPL